MYRAGVIPAPMQVGHLSTRAGWPESTGGMGKRAGHKPTDSLARWLDRRALSW